MSTKETIITESNDNMIPHVVSSFDVHLGKKISARTKNKALADVLGVTLSTAKKFQKFQMKDLTIMSNPYIPKIQAQKSAMLDAITNGLMTWESYHAEIAKLADVDKIYALNGVPEGNSFEKENITKMRCFLFHFYRHGYWNTAATCDYLGVSILEVQEWTSKFHSFKEAMTVIISARDDYAESQLLKQMNGEGMPAVTATTFYLKTMGKKRGWGEQIEVNHGTRSNLTKEQMDRMVHEHNKRIISGAPQDIRQAILDKANAQGSGSNQKIASTPAQTDQYDSDLDPDTLFSTCGSAPVMDVFSPTGEFILTKKIDDEDCFETF